jgi:hypothetical protein
MSSLSNHCCRGPSLAGVLGGKQRGRAVERPRKARPTVFRQLLRGEDGNARLPEEVAIGLDPHRRRHGGVREHDVQAMERQFRDEAVRIVL